MPLVLKIIKFLIRILFTAVIPYKVEIETGTIAVVVSDIRDNYVAVGMPAKVMKENIDINDYK